MAEYDLLHMQYSCTAVLLHSRYDSVCPVRSTNIPPCEMLMPCNPAGDPLEESEGDPRKECNRIFTVKRLAFVMTNMRTNWKLVMLTGRNKLP